MKLNVPYYSQYLDVSDPFWMLRACGAVSFKMVAEFQGVEVPDIITLCNEARDKGGYDMTNGWVHDYLVTKAQGLGLHAERKEGLTDIKEITDFLDAGNPIIVSVEKKVLEQTRFHMLVIVGYEIKTNPESLVPVTYFYYHEPESTDKDRGAYRMCDMKTFMDYWRGKAIFVSK